MRVYERGQFTPQMWGKDQIVMTAEDVAALLMGKKLWTTVCGEYAVEIIFNFEEEDDG